MYLCTYVRMYTCIYIYIIYIYTYVNIHVHLHIHICMCIYINTEYRKKERTSKERKRERENYTILYLAIYTYTHIISIVILTLISMMVCCYYGTDSTLPELQQAPRQESYYDVLKCCFRASTLKSSTFSAGHPSPRFSVLCCAALRRAQGNLPWP